MKVFHRCQIFGYDCIHLNKYVKKDIAHCTLYISNYLDKYAVSSFEFATVSCRNIYYHPDHMILRNRYSMLLLEVTQVWKKKLNTQNLCQCLKIWQEVSFFCLRVTGFTDTHHREDLFLIFTSFHFIKVFGHFSKIIEIKIKSRLSPTVLVLTSLKKYFFLLLEKLDIFCFSF